MIRYPFQGTSCSRSDRDPVPQAQLKDGGWLGRGEPKVGGLWERTVVTRKQRLEEEEEEEEGAGAGREMSRSGSGCLEEVPLGGNGCNGGSGGGGPGPRPGSLGDPWV